MNDHLSWKELLIRFTVRAFRKLLSIYVFSSFSFGFEGRMWDLNVLVPDHCLSFTLYTFLLIFLMILYMYIVPGQGQTTPWDKI